MFGIRQPRKNPPLFSVVSCSYAAKKRHVTDMRCCCFRKKRRRRQPLPRPHHFHTKRQQIDQHRLQRSIFIDEYLRKYSHAVSFYSVKDQDCPLCHESMRFTRVLRFNCENSHLFHAVCAADYIFQQSESLRSFKCPRCTQM